MKPHLPTAPSVSHSIQTTAQNKIIIFTMPHNLVALKPSADSDLPACRCDWCFSLRRIYVFGNGMKQKLRNTFRWEHCSWNQFTGSPALKWQIRQAQSDGRQRHCFSARFRTLIRTRTGSLSPAPAKRSPARPHPENFDPPAQTRFRVIRTPAERP